ncbi:MAG: class I SAM-dependent methyltransferase [Oscillatoriales cyanobacterium SM2_1_8]|nr:class I SAM-dependent methyltransferase [Oscillatoriales cyanobacterium SM2_1_8]
MDVFAASPLSANPLDRAALYKAKSQTGARGEMTFPCLPSLKAVFFQQVQELLGALAQNFTAEEWQKLEALLVSKIDQGFAASPHARVLFRFEPPDLTQGLTGGFRIALDLQVPSTAEKYQRWTKTRQGALFGAYPDAKALAVLAELTGDRPPADVRILDIGAGPGRNTLPLAAKGYPVTAIELAPVFVAQLQQELAQASLVAEVILGNVLDPAIEILPAHYNLVLISEVVPHFRSADEVRQLLCRVCDALLPGGEVLMGGLCRCGRLCTQPLGAGTGAGGLVVLLDPWGMGSCRRGFAPPFVGASPGIALRASPCAPRTLAPHHLVRELGQRPRYFPPPGHPTGIAAVVSLATAVG